MVLKQRTHRTCWAERRWVWRVHVGVWGPQFESHSRRHSISCCVNTSCSFQVLLADACWPGPAAVQAEKTISSTLPQHFCQTDVWSLIRWGTTPPPRCPAVHSPCEQGNVTRVRGSGRHKESWLKCTCSTEQIKKRRSKERAQQGFAAVN